MLATLLLLSLLPLAAVPFLDMGRAEDEIAPAETDTDAPDPNASTTGLGATDAGNEINEDGRETSVGEFHAVQIGGDPNAFPDFVPGEDIVEIDFSDDPEPPVLSVLSDENGVTATFFGGDGVETTLEFDGLAELPSDDIMLRLLDEEGQEPAEISLTDALALDVVASAIDPVDEESATPEEEPEIDPEAVLDPVDPDATASTVEGPVLDPVDPDTPDEPGPDVEGPVLDPVDPDTPDAPGPDAEGPILDPVDPNAEEFDAGADLVLRGLLERDSENTTGMSALLSAANSAGTTDVTLTDGDDSYFGDTGGGGNATLELNETVPVITSGESLSIVDGADGNDQIDLGDSAGFGFGGEGDDSLSSGAGVAGLYGGAGSDQITLGEAGGYGDGGQGDDTLQGGSSADILEGGEHYASGVTGDDYIVGGAGDDTIRGGFGADTLLGGDGNDVIDHLGRGEEREILTQREFAWHTSDDVDSLDGGAGDDTLIFDGNDIAAGGTGDDVFWLYSDAAGGADVAEVQDFIVGEDFLRVTINPSIHGLDDPSVEVRASDNGQDGEVYVNGALVAVLAGAPTVAATDIYAEVRPDIFP